MVNINTIKNICYKKCDNIEHDYLPNSLVGFSCYEKSNNFVNCPNRVVHLDLTYNTELKRVLIPHKIKMIEIKKKLFYERNNHNIEKKIMQIEKRNKKNYKNKGY